MHPLARSIAVALLLSAGLAQAAPWTYRGTLNDSGVPANGRYDIRLSLLDASGAKSLAYPLTFSGVEVKNGAFAIDVDFGMDLTQFGALRLKTEVAQGGSGFIVLGEPKAFDAKAALGSVCWDTQGNAGTNPGTDFLGTTDNQPLLLRVNNQRALQVVPDPVSPNLVAGYSGNSVTASVYGASIGGGGEAVSQNRVTDNHGTVGGGKGNTAGDDDAVVSDAEQATVSGGVDNRAMGYGSTVGGGGLNTASGQNSTVGGGAFNTASGFMGSVGGGSMNCAGGDFSWAGGRRAKVRPGTTSGLPGDGCSSVSLSGDADGDNGSFVWADSQSGDFVSTGPNQFLVRADGGIGINTNKLGNYPNFRLAEMTIRNSTANGNVDLNLMTSNARGYSLAVIPDGASGAGAFYLQELNAISTGEPTWTPRLIITPGGQTQVQGGAVGTISDARLKKNIGDIERPLDTLLALRGHRFEYLDPARALGATGERIGFVAQEVREVMPQWVSENSDGYYSVAASGFEALAVEAMREQQQLIRDLERRNESLQDALRSLSERLAALETAKEQ